jgi:hypothetical protein
METRELIKALSADAGPPPLSLRSIWTGAVIAALVIAGVAFFLTLGPRADLAEAVATVRFACKLAVFGALAATGIAALVSLSRPGDIDPQRFGVLALAPILMLLAVLAELAAIAPAEWRDRLVGSNSAVCLLAVAGFGLAPLALFLLALRNAAPTRPVLAGAVAGLSAGGVAATFYALHCTDDSPLFVATWYVLAIALLTLAGALAGKWLLRW